MSGKSRGARTEGGATRRASDDGQSPAIKGECRAQRGEGPPDGGFLEDVPSPDK